ncbi:MAG: hypothetical protein ACR2RE_05995 [Geminicoccaceae bacterium]
MNGVQLTFFNFAGYLIPGIIFSLALVPAFYLIPGLSGFFDVVAHLLIRTDGSVPTSTIAALFLPGLAWCFLVGVLISDTAVLLNRQLRDRGLAFYRSNDRSVFLELSALDWQTALKDSARLREYVAQRATGGWDLYGSAARARMCIASGFALTINALTYAWVAALPCLALLITGALLIILGMKRHADYLNTLDIATFAEVHESKAKGGAD